MTWRAIAAAKCSCPRFFGRPVTAGYNNLQQTISNHSWNNTRLSIRSEVLCSSGRVLLSTGHYARPIHNQLNLLLMAVQSHEIQRWSEEYLQGVSALT